MRLDEFLRERFSGGIQYDEAVNLCMAVYSSGSIVSAFAIDEELSMDVIADAFSGLAELGLIRGYAPYKAAIYGAQYHSINDKGHWIEVQASILKLGRTYDKHVIDLLM